MGAPREKRAQGSRPKRPATHDHTNQPQSKKHQSKAIPKKGKRRTYDTTEIVRGEARDVGDDDVEAFDEYKHFHGFLTSLDPHALAGRINKQKRAPSKVDIISSKPPREAIAKSTRKHAQLAHVGSDDHEIAVNTSEGEMENKVSSSGTENSLGESSESYSDNDTGGEYLAEADYENLNRNFKNQPSTSTRLPVKSRDGRIHLIDAQALGSGKVAKTNKSTEILVSSTDHESETESSVEPDLTPAQRLAQTKETLARIASTIIEDPENEIDLLGKLREVLTHGNLRERQFALLTMTTVYKDIIPGYRIRPLTDVEKAEKITKEVKKTRNFEQGLVSNYQQFVTSLMSFCKTNRREAVSETKNPLKRAAVIASCSLLSSAPHFNFRTELFSILVNQICRKTTDELFSRSLSTIINIFIADEEGDASFEAARLLTKKMKDREYQVHESAISVFLHLRLLSDLDVRASASKVERKTKVERKFINKKNKKLIKAQKEVEKDLREAETTVDVETRERLQSDTLKLVFATYFRILQTGNRAVMGAALEGLARFAHLINVDFFGDLLEVLKQLLADVNEVAEKTLSTRASLLCIVTAFALQTGQSGTKETMTLDLSTFLQELYTIILDLCFNTDVEKSARDCNITDSGQRSTINVATEAEMLIRALDAVFFKQRAQSTQARLTAFVKRLSVCAANLPEKSAVGSLDLIKRLAARYSRLVSLYNTDDTAADGTYDGSTNNLELTKTSTTNAYELALFQKHFSPRVKAAATALLETLRESATNARR